MKKHFQDGTIYEASGSFFVRYFASIDGVRKRVSHKLCDRDETHISIDCELVLALRAEHMVTLAGPNRNQPQKNSSPTIGKMCTCPR
jgi:hypothetical protein